MHNHLHNLLMTLNILFTLWFQICIHCRKRLRNKFDLKYGFKIYMISSSVFVAFCGFSYKEKKLKKKWRNDKQNYKKAYRKGTMKITKPHLNLIHDDETKHHTLCSSSYSRGNLLFLGKIYAVVDYVLRLLGGQSTKKQKSSQKT